MSFFNYITKGGSSMGKFDGILIATDLDGTLLRGDKSISRENLSAIEYFKENGGIFTIVTGRPLVIIGEVYDIVRPNAPIGCFNGGGVYDMQKGEYVFSHPLERDALILIEYVENLMPDMSIQVCGFKNSYFCKMNDAMERHRITANFPDLRCHYKDVKEDISKVLFAHSDEAQLFKLRDILKSHPLAEKFDFIRSDAEYFEILPKGMSKGENLSEIARVMGIDVKKTIGVGDNDNDVSMIERAGVGIAVANASDSAKKAADIITVSNEENAIEKVIKDLDKEIIKV